jgi:hypothetical protein
MRKEATCTAEALPSVEPVNVPEDDVKVRVIPYWQIMFPWPSYI